MSDEVKIDKQVFHDRLSQFISAWKADKRSGDGLFAGAGSIAILMGKVEDQSGVTFRKNNAMHASAPLICCQHVLTQRSIGLVAWLRVSYDAFRLHNRNFIHRHNSQEGYVHW